MNLLLLNFIAYSILIEKKYKYNVLNLIKHKAFKGIILEGFHSETSQSKYP